jgi:hypothetical protein
MRHVSHVIVMMTQPCWCVNMSWMSHVTHVMSHIWTSPDLCECVMSHMWMSHVQCHICEWVMSHTHQSCHTYEWVMTHLCHSGGIRGRGCIIMPHIWMRQCTGVNESCHTYGWVMSRVTHTNESCHTYEYVMTHLCHGGGIRGKGCIIMPHIRIHQCTSAFESCHTYRWVMSRVTNTNKSCLTCVTEAGSGAEAASSSPTWSSARPWLRSWVLGQVTRVNESRHMYQWVMSHI